MCPCVCTCEYPFLRARVYTFVSVCASVRTYECVRSLCGSVCTRVYVFQIKGVDSLVLFYKRETESLINIPSLPYCLHSRESFRIWGPEETAGSN